MPHNSERSHNDTENISLTIANNIQKDRLSIQIKENIVDIAANSNINILTSINNNKAIYRYLTDTSYNAVSNMDSSINSECIITVKSNINNECLADVAKISIA